MAAWPGRVGFLLEPRRPLRRIQPILDDQTKLRIARNLQAPLKKQGVGVGLSAQKTKKICRLGAKFQVGLFRPMRSETSIATTKNMAHAEVIYGNRETSAIEFLWRHQVARAARQLQPRHERQGQQWSRHATSHRAGKNVDIELMLQAPATQFRPFRTNNRYNDPSPLAAEHR
jgi:hypothetical protein